MKNAITPSLVLPIVLALFILMGPGQVIAGPDKISYQGKATDASGNPLPDGDYAFTFQLYAYPTAGVEHWEEIATVHIAGGLFTHLLGSVTPIPTWLFPTYDSLFLDVWVGPQHLSTRIPLTSAGYAMSVNSVDGATGGTIDGRINLRNVVAGNIPISLIPESTGNGAITLSRDDGNVGISMSGLPSIYLYGTARGAFISMSQEGTQSVQLPSSAIEASEMLDEPGVGSDNNNNIFLTGPIQFLAGRTMTAPTDGYVLVTATAFVTIQHSYGTLSSCMFGVSDNITDFATSTIAKITLPSSLPSGGYEFPLSSHALFPISAGSQAYYALGSETGATNATVWNVQLSECFFRTAYTTVSNPKTPLGSTANPATPFEPEEERLEALAHHDARVQAELARITAELEAVRQEVNDLKNSDKSKR